VNLSFFLVQNYLQLWLMTENGCMMVGKEWSSLTIKQWNREVSMEQVLKWFIPRQEKDFNTHL
jgi:hypothetical protein